MNKCLELNREHKMNCFFPFSLKIKIKARHSNFGRRYRDSFLNGWRRRKWLQMHHGDLKPSKLEKSTSKTPTFQQPTHCQRWITTRIWLVLQRQPSTAKEENENYKELFLSSDQHLISTTLAFQAWKLWMTNPNLYQLLLSLDLH